MKKLKVILMLFAVALFLAPSSLNAGATCSPCGSQGISVTCPSNPNGSGCGYWYEDDGNVAVVICHPSGNHVIVDCQGLGEGPTNEIVP